MEHWLLTLMVFTPLIGAAVVLCLPSEGKDAIRWTATAFTVPPMLPLPPIVPPLATVTALLPIVPLSSSVPLFTKVLPV